jgi:hypothetical protein
MTQKALLFGAAALAIAAGMSPASAFASGPCSGHRIHHWVADRVGWRAAYLRGHGWGCGPYSDNDDNWDIDWRGTCYYPYYGNHRFDFW